MECWRFAILFQVTDGVGCPHGLAHTFSWSQHTLLWAQYWGERLCRGTMLLLAAPLGTRPWSVNTLTCPAVRCGLPLITPREGSSPFNIPPPIKVQSELKNASEENGCTNNLSSKAPELPLSYTQSCGESVLVTVSPWQLACLCCRWDLGAHTGLSHTKQACTFISTISPSSCEQFNGLGVVS